MEVKLQKESVRFYKKLTDTNFNHEETMEMIVPDSLPDVLDIIDTDGTVMLRGKESETGKMSVSGLVRAHIIYTPDGESGLRSISVQIPFTAVFEHTEIKAATKYIVNAELASIDTRMINSRKLIVRADSMLNISLFDEAELQLASGLDSDAEIEVLKSSCELNPIVDVTEKSFSFSDELSFPASKPPVGAIMKSSARLAVEDAKTVGSKLILKGSAYITVIYTSPMNGEVNSLDMNVPFSQIVELSQEGDDLSFDANIIPTGVYIQESGDEMSGSQAIAVEISAVAQVMVWKKLNTFYISDSYSTACETSCNFIEYSMSSLVSDQLIRETFRETIQTGGQVRSVICTSLLPGKVRLDEERFKIPVSASVIYTTEEGKVSRAGGRFEFCFDFEPVRNAELSASLQLGEVFATPTAGGVEIRASTELRLHEYRNNTISPVSEIELKEDCTKEVSSLPSLVICRVGNGDTLWSLAKKYNSTRDLIMQANRMEDTTGIAENDLLLISKKR